MRLGIEHARPGIYLVTNTANGKRYVGSSVNCRKRVEYHLNGWGSIPLRASVQHYGRDIFTVEVLEHCERGELPIAEAKWIKILAPEYNLREETEGGGHTVSETTKDKIRAKATGRRHSEDTKRKLSVDWASHDHSERRERMRAAAIGKIPSAESRAKKSAALKGKPWSAARRAAEAGRSL